MIRMSLLLLLFTTFLFADTLYIRPAQSENDISHDYYFSLLQLVMDKTEKEYGKTTIVCKQAVMTQMRSLSTILHGDYIDVDWAGTAIDREKELGTIYIPLNRGLLGYRIPVIRAEDTTLFSQIKTVEQLKKVPCIQGTHWPDSDIMEAAGLHVKRTPQFGSMYPMLLNRRVKWFPRGINEVYAEVESVKGNLVAYDKLIVAYTFPMYFFVKKERTELIKRIDTGLRLALADGSFDTHMKSHKAFARVFPLDRLKNSTIIYLENPYLSERTPLNDTTLWLKIGTDSEPSDQ